MGTVFGPVYPAALMVISDNLDEELRVGVMGLFGSTGGAGAAAIPL
jgi:MFS family permease